MTLTRGSERVTARRQAAVAVLVAAAIVVGLWSAPPTVTPASVTIDLQRLPVGAAAEVSWRAEAAFAGVTASGELDRRRHGPDTVLALLGVSPDGRYEVKRESDRVVWVLRSDTGYPVFDLNIGSGSIRRTAWESDGALVLDVWHGGHAAAVRCSLAPACERAGGSTTRKTLPPPPPATKVTLKASEELTSGVRIEPEQRERADENKPVAPRGERTQQVAQADPPAEKPVRTTASETTDRRRARDWMSEAVEEYLRAYSSRFAYDSERDGEYDAWQRYVDRDGYYGDRHR